MIRGNRFSRENEGCEWILVSGVLSVNSGVMYLECRGLSRGSVGWENGVSERFGFFVNVGVSDCDG